MKKFISLLIIVCMFVVTMSVDAGAAGQILFQDTFSGDSLEENWLPMGHPAFFIEEGRAILDGGLGARVLQSNYDEENGGNKIWNSGVSISVDIALLDYASNSTEYSVGLWWKDFQVPEHVEFFPGDEVEDGIIYELYIRTESRKVELTSNFGDMIPETTTVEGEEVEPLETTAVVASYDIPDDVNLACDYTNPPIVNLGMRIGQNYISGYLDGKLIFTYNTPSVIGDKRASPICLLNEWNSLYVGFDNFTVATEDYPLFADDTAVATGDASDTAAPTPTESKEPETSVVIKTEIVSSVDKDGNVVTNVVENSEVVTVAPPVADTNPAPSVGGSSTATGDMAFVVVAVMVVALGTAVVVRKVNVR